MQDFRFDPVQMPPGVDALRQEVRAFIAEEVAAGSFTPKRNSWSSFDADFSRKCGERWLHRHDLADAIRRRRENCARTLCHDRGNAGRRRAGRRDWVADRQSGHQILRHGSERAKQLILPRSLPACAFSVLA